MAEYDRDWLIDHLGEMTNAQRLQFERDNPEWHYTGVDDHPGPKSPPSGARPGRGKRPGRPIEHHGAADPSESSLRGRSKYGNVRTVYRGREYASRKEARYAQELDLRVHAGELAGWAPQVPFELAGGIRYIADFVELAIDGRYHVIDVKGVRTREFRLKAKLFREKYGMEIELKC